MSFVIPSWIRDRTLPSSPVTAYADSGAMLIRSRTRTVGTGSPADTEGAAPGMETAGESEPSAGASELRDDLFPQPAWDEPATPLGEPRSDEVIARKVLLDGGQAIWLDDNDGERIRTLDPAAPRGERVQYAKLSTVRPGTYLLLRRGHPVTVPWTASRPGCWAIRRRRSTPRRRRGRARSTAESRRGVSGTSSATCALHGVKSAGRAWAWTDPSLILPRNEGDFRALLSWLGIPAEPTVSNAKRKRRAHSSGRLRRAGNTRAGG